MVFQYKLYLFLGILSDSFPLLIPDFQVDTRFTLQIANSMKFLTEEENREVGKGYNGPQAHSKIKKHMQVFDLHVFTH